MSTPNDASTSEPRSDVARAALRLFYDCASQGWAGHDPYDALNSPLLGYPPLRSSRHARILLTQLLKRSPVNLRGLMRIERSRNPKALALFLSAAIRLRRLGWLPDEGHVGELVELLRAGRSIPSRDAWGYTFPWQTRTELVPKGRPNLVCTVFAANALLDTYELLSDPRCLAMAEGAARFIIDDLFWIDRDGQASLAYPLASSRTPVHNANLLGAALLCRVSSYTGSQELLQRGLRLARHAASRQQPNGSWMYGDSAHWQWIDNFHTGFNLCALREVAMHSRSDEFDAVLARGFDFYRRTFFLQDGAPRYRADRTYPIDIHCVAQSIITLVQLRHLEPGCLDVARDVFRWASHHMLGPSGRFYYQLWPWFSNKISYIRWSQAWMVLAMAIQATALAEDDQSGLRFPAAA